MVSTHPRNPQLSDETPVSFRVLEAVASAEDRSPLAFERPLHDVVDADALDALYEDGGGVTVSFDYLGHCVTVHADGQVTVDGQED